MKYSLAQLAKAAEVTTHVARHHIRRGLVPWAHGHADSAYYDDDHLHRLLAVEALRRTGMKLRDIGGVLANADDSELRRLAGVEQAPPPPQPPPPAPEPPRAATPSPSPAPTPAPGREVWQRFPLGPGVELHVRVDMGGEVARMVQVFEKAWAQAKG